MGIEANLGSVCYTNKHAKIKNRARKRSTSNFFSANELLIENDYNPYFLFPDLFI